MLGGPSETTERMFHCFVFPAHRSSLPAKNKQVLTLRTPTQLGRNLLLNCTFSSTKIMSKNRNKCRAKGGEDTCSLGSQNPQQASSGKAREDGAGCSLWAPAFHSCAQPVNSSSHINTHTPQRKKKKYQQGINTNLNMCRSGNSNYN